MPGASALACRLLAAFVWLRTVAVTGAGPGAGALMLREFRQQLRKAGEGWGPESEASGQCDSGFGLMQDYIIRTRDSLSAGATFLSAPAGVISPAQCLRACCGFPSCTVAVVERVWGGGRSLDWARGLEPRPNTPPALSCYLFNCTNRGSDVCRFSPHKGYSSFSRPLNDSQHPEPRRHGNRNDEAPHCDAGQDVILLLPTDWVLLDGRGSADDQGIVRYEWTLLQGDPSVDMKLSISVTSMQVYVSSLGPEACEKARESQPGEKLSCSRFSCNLCSLIKLSCEHNSESLDQQSPQPAMLKLSGLREGMYVIQLLVTDTIGQKSDDNVTVTVMPPKHQTTDCTGVCSRYQFICDDGCCIDITMACDGTAQCPDRSDEIFCQSFNVGRKSVIHTTLAAGSGQDGATWPSSDSFQKASAENPKPVEQFDTEMTQSSRVEGRGKSNSGQLPAYCLAPPAMGPCEGHFPRWYFDSASGTCRHFIYSGCQGNRNNFLQELDCKNGCAEEKGDDSLETSSVETSQDDIMMSKTSHRRGGHPVPESGAVLPLALGLAITALLLLMIGCRLQLVRHKLKKLRPITSEESDYLINGMYL